MPSLKYFDQATQSYKYVLGGMTQDSADARYLTSGFRNVIRNGDFCIGQRGNGNFTTSGVYTIDGYILAFVGGATVSRPAVSGDIAAITGTASDRFMQVISSAQTVAANYVNIQMPIENVGTLAGKVVTLSFWAVVSSAGGPYKIGVMTEQYFGSGGSALFQKSIGTLTVDAAAWRKYSLTFTVPSITGKTIGSGSFLNLYLYFSSGADNAVNASNIGLQNWTCQIVDLQLEAGTVATPFERLPQQQQLAWCQRYFYRRHSLDNPYTQFAGGYRETSTGVMAMSEVPVDMRATPTFSTSAPSTFSLSAITADVTGRQSIRVNATALSSYTAGAGYIIQAAATTAAYFDFSAEL